MKFKVSFEIIDFLQLFLFVTVYTILIYLNFVTEWKIANDAKNAVIFNSGQRILVISALFSVLSGSIQLLWMRHLFCEIVNTLNGIDEQVTNKCTNQTFNKFFYNFR